MKFRPVTITDMEDNTLEFNPMDIMHVQIEDDYIKIMESEGQVSPIKVTKLLRDNYYYSSWDYFIQKLNIYFEL